MPRYEFACDICGVETVESLPMAQCAEVSAFPVCCGIPMRRDYRTAPMMAVPVSGVANPHLLDGDDMFRYTFDEDPDGE